MGPRAELATSLFLGRSEHAAVVRPHNEIPSRQNVLGERRTFAPVQTVRATRKRSHSPRARAPRPGSEASKCEPGKNTSRDGHAATACFCRRSLSASGSHVTLSVFESAVILDPEKAPTMLSYRSHLPGEVCVLCPARRGVPSRARTMSMLADFEPHTASVKRRRSVEFVGDRTQTRELAADVDECCGHGGLWCRGVHSEEGPCSKRLALGSGQQQRFRFLLVFSGRSARPRWSSAQREALKQHRASGTACDYQEYYIYDRDERQAW